MKDNIIEDVNRIIQMNRLLKDSDPLEFLLKKQNFEKLEEYKKILVERLKDKEIEKEKKVPRVKLRLVRD